MSLLWRQPPPWTPNSLILLRNRPDRFRNDSGVVLAVPDSVQAWVDRHLALAVTGVRSEEVWQRHLADDVGLAPATVNNHLRHTFAFQLAEATDADAYEFERRLGHRSQPYIARYTNPPEDIAAGYVEAMDGPPAAALDRPDGGRPGRGDNSFRHPAGAPGRRRHAWPPWPRRLGWIPGQWRGGWPLIASTGWQGWPEGADRMLVPAGFRTSCGR